MNLSEAKLRLKRMSEHPATTNSEVEAITTIIVAMIDYEIFLAKMAKEGNQEAHRLMTKREIK